MIPLFQQMIDSRQLSSRDAEALQQSNGDAPETEEAVLQWLAQEYDIAFSVLEEIEPDADLLARFPARVLLKEELLPLMEVNCPFMDGNRRLLPVYFTNNNRRIATRRLDDDRIAARCPQINIGGRVNIRYPVIRLTIMG